MVLTFNTVNLRNGLLVFMLFLAVPLKVVSQTNVEQNLESEINGVTVFLKGAQITRNKSVEFPAGESLLNFSGLSPYVDQKSIRLKASGRFTVLSVNFHQNYLEKSKKEQEFKKWQDKIEALEQDIENDEATLAVLQEKLNFLKQNQSIKGESSLTVAQLKATAEFFEEQFSNIKTAQLAKERHIRELRKEIERIENTITSLTGDEELPVGEIWVKIDAEQAGKTEFSLSYLVESAGWFPSYDLRVAGIDEPLQLTYKANVYQKTQQSWDNVKLTFSSSDPKKSGVAPQLQTYYLNYHLPPPNYNRDNINAVTGVVLDENRKGVPGVNVSVKNTTIGTVTDINGQYSLTLPNDAELLIFSAVGYVQQEKPINNPVINVQMVPDLQQLQELVVVGYGANRKRDLAEVADEESMEESRDIKIRGAVATIPVQATVAENAASVEFSVDNSYRIPSDGKNYSVDMKVYQIPVEYEHYCVPKVNTDAFLRAHVIAWEKYNLLEGEANIYFEDTYIGKSLIDLGNAGDTLQLSLGTDEGVVVNRELEKQFTSRQFLGNKKEETKAWKIKVKNNRSQPINMQLLDQIPVSTLEEIEVEVQKSTGASIDEDNGTVAWKLSIDPKTMKEVVLRYSVKYPKNRNLVIQ